MDPKPVLVSEAVDCIDEKGAGPCLMNLSAEQRELMSAAECEIAVQRLLARLTRVLCSS
jgi:hypothetical protein